MIFLFLGSEEVELSLSKDEEGAEETELVEEEESSTSRLKGKERRLAEEEENLPSELRWREGLGRLEIRSRTSRKERVEKMRRGWRL